MRYAEFEKIISVARLAKYLRACDHNCSKAVLLYRVNIRLSQQLFAVLSIFEVAIRNAIDGHYRSVWGPNWIETSIQSNGFLNNGKCSRSNRKVLEVVRKLGTFYKHDKAVAELSFGFWTNSFNSKEFAAGGSSLLKIFPKKPIGVNHTAIYHKLVAINNVRNRIAHHEPICFRKYPLRVSSENILQQYNEIIELLDWMGINARSLLIGVDRVLAQAKLLERFV